MEAKEYMKYKNWVVVGDVLNQTKYACKILNQLKAAGFNVVGVNPNVQDSSIYNSLSEVPYTIDVVDMCINPKYSKEIIEEVKALNIDKVLIQPGAECDHIFDCCQGTDINAIKGCALQELARR